MDHMVDVDDKTTPRSLYVRRDVHFLREYKWDKAAGFVNRRPRYARDRYVLWVNPSVEKVSVERVKIERGWCFRHRSRWSACRRTVWQGHGAMLRQL